MPSIACAGSTTTCLAVGQYWVYNNTTYADDYYGAAVVIDDGVPGTATTLAGTFIPSGVACSSSTACVMAGSDANGGALLPVTVAADGTATFDTVQDVANTTSLTGVACPASANACVAVGEGASSAVAVDLPGGAAGTAGTAEDLPLNTYGVMAVACSSASQCLAAQTSGTYQGDEVVPVSLSGGNPGTPQTVSNLDYIDGVSCVSGAGAAICEIVGQTSATDPFGNGAAVEFTGVTGTSAGTEQTIEQTPPSPYDDSGQLDGVSCLSTSYCVGVGGFGGASGGSAVAFQPNAAIGDGTSDPNVSELTAVECQSASSCLEAGDGYIDDLPLTAATGTLSGTVTVAPQDAGAPPSAVSGAPVEACATDGSLCVAGASGTDSSGAYSLAVPVGYSYVVTALSPAGANDTQASSSPTASVTSSGVSGIDVELTRPPALLGGVTVTSPDFGTESASTVNPTVNWQQPFDVHIAASAFPSGQVTTVETLVITGTNGFTGQPQSETVYAGGETTTASGESAANGLVVGTGGVDIAVPALSPIHGPVSIAVNSFSVSSSPTGVALAGSGQLKFTQGALSGQAMIVATDFGVDHTVGTPTISGADASTFALSAPMTCAPQPTIVQASGADADQSCSLGVTWTPPAAPAEGTYQATMNVPVTNSAGQPATLQVQLLGCDDRVSTGACQGQTLGSLYIDPSGTVETTTTDGVTVPLDGATVTMSQLGSGGTYTAVPNGSDVMSPANRTNPQITGEDGGFGWDTLAGTYEITASDSECSTSVTSTPETVPPPATNIDLILDCSGITQSASSTTLGFDPTTVAPGQAVELTATVSGNSPTGTVAFASGGTTLATVPVDASTGEASYMTSALPPGQDTVTATYSGDASNATSSGQEKLTVESAPSVATVTAFSAAPSISTSGASVSYSATVTPVSGSADPTGTVSFTATLGANSTPLCTTTIQGTTASCSSASAPVGADTITATYGGDTNFSASSGTTAETVSTAPTISGTTITGTPSVGQTLSAVAATVTGSPTPTPTYQWSSDSGPITGATGSTYVVSAGDVGHTLTVTITETNTAGSASVTSAATATVTGAPQTDSINFSSTAPSNATVGGATYTAAASASSGLPVALTIDASAMGVCSITSGGVVSFTGVGTCVINANQAGDSNYTAAPQVQQSVVVAQASQSINFSSTAPSNATVGGATYVAAASASSGLPVALTIDASATGVCSITSGGVVSFTGVGTCVIDADQSGGSNYTSAPQVQQSVVVAKVSQSISFSSTPPTETYGTTTPYTPAATGGASGNPVTFSIDATSSAGTCAINATTGLVSFTNAGTCVIDADQSGGSNYTAATQVQQRVVVAQVSQSISFSSTAPAGATVGGATYSPVASATSGLTVALTVDSSSSSVCAIASGVVSFTGVGSCTLDANQAADSNYTAATQVQQSFSVGQGSQAITFNAEGGSAVNSMSGPQGSTITLPGAPTLAGSTFDGWFTAASGGTALTSPYTLSSSRTLFAQWTLNSTVTITFNAEGGSAVNSMSGPQGSTITLPGAPTLAGSTFDGWFAAATAGTALTSPYTLSSSRTVFAQWTLNGVGGGGGAPTTSTVSISNIPSAAIYGGQFSPSFKTSGNGTVFSVASSTSSVCTVSGTTVNFVGVGECTLMASVAATVTHTAATGSSQSFEVSPATATVSITNLPVSAVKGTQFSPSFKTSGNGTVFSVTSSTSSVCTVSGTTVNFVGAGTCSLTVTVGATADYLAASNTSTISVKSIPKKLDTGTIVALSRTAISYRAQNSVAVVVHVTSQASGHRLSGKVRIMVGNRLLCVATINSHGVAECTLAARTLGRGTYSVEATYEDNSFYNQSTSAAVKLRVN
jgi:hypothetical protein